MWLDDEALADHFRAVTERIKSGSRSTGDDDWEDIPTAQNEYTRDIRKG